MPHEGRRGASRLGVDKREPLSCHHWFVFVVSFHRDIKCQKIFSRPALICGLTAEGGAQTAADNGWADKAYTVEAIVNVLAGHAPVGQLSGEVREQGQGQKALRRGDTEGAVSGLFGVNMMGIKVKCYAAEGGYSVLCQLKPRRDAQILPRQIGITAYILHA